MWNGQFNILLEHGNSASIRAKLGIVILIRCTEMVRSNLRPECFLLPEIHSCRFRCQIRRDRKSTNQSAQLDLFRSACVDLLLDIRHPIQDKCAAVGRHVELVHKVVDFGQDVGKSVALFHLKGLDFLKNK